MPGFRTRLSCSLLAGPYRLRERRPVARILFLGLVRFGFPPDGFPTAGFESFALFPFLVCVEDFFVVDEVLSGLDVV